MRWWTTPPASCPACRIGPQAPRHGHHLRSERALFGRAPGLARAAQHPLQGAVQNRAPQQELLANRSGRRPSLHLPPRTFWISLLGIEVGLFILLLILFWNFQLCRKVEERTRRLAAELEKSARAEDLQRLNTEIRQAMKAADAATEAKSRFLANISHEIRTPLHGIISFTELAYLKNNPLPRNHQRTILDLSYALLDIVNDTLDVSKIEAGEMDRDTAPFMLDEVILRVCDMTLRGSMARELECLIDKDFPEVTGSPETVKSKVFLTTTVSSAHYGLSSWLKTLGLTGKDVVVKNMDRPPPSPPSNTASATS